MVLWSKAPLSLEETASNFLEEDAENVTDFTNMWDYDLLKVSLVHWAWNWDIIMTHAANT